MQDMRIIVTGGTIDKVHDPRTEGLAFSPDGATHLPEMLRIGCCHFPVVQKLMLKDSLYFDDADREAILTAGDMLTQLESIDYLRRHRQLSVAESHTALTAGLRAVLS